MYGQLKRYLEKNATGFVAKATKETEVICDVLHNVEHKQEVERLNLRAGKVFQLKLERFIAFW
jgi:hypothetical protein